MVVIRKCDSCGSLDSVNCVPLYESSYYLSRVDGTSYDFKDVDLCPKCLIYYTKTLQDSFLGNNSEELEKLNKIFIEGLNNEK